MHMGDKCATLPQQWQLVKGVVLGSLDSVHVLSKMVKVVRVINC